MMMMMMMMMMMIQTCRAVALKVELVELVKADSALPYFSGRAEELERKETLARVIMIEIFSKACRINLEHIIMRNVSVLYNNVNSLSFYIHNKKYW
jgi:hypothetical protein